MARSPVIADTAGITPATLRTCLSRFATGVAVVTFDAEHGRHGLTISAFTSVSLEPPILLVSIARTSRAHAALHGVPFCVNILGAEQEDLARHFAGGTPANPQWTNGIVAPRLTGALAHLECRPWRTYDGGDHTLFLGEIVAADWRGGDALAYVNSRFTTIAEPALGIEYLI